jgi:hypothetical protein
MAFSYHNPLKEGGASLYLVRWLGHDRDGGDRSLPRDLAQDLRVRKFGMEKQFLNFTILK